VLLSESAACPDKRDFVIREAVEAAGKAISQARSVAAAAQSASERTERALASATLADRQAEAKINAAAGMPEVLKSAQAAAGPFVETLVRAEQAARDGREDREVANLALAAAEAKRSSLQAVLYAEWLEDRGARSTGADAWARAAREAQAAQRRLAVIESEVNRHAASRDVNRARRSLDGLLAAGPAQKGDPLKDARSKAAAALVEARGRLTAAEKQSAAAQSASKGPLSTEYTPRGFEFPRAKTTYRDTPSNAPYRRVSTGRRLALARWIVDRGNPLAARVAVNHVWARHFGRPLVGSMYDFGLRTPQPLHHRLLDWLAVEFMDSGWSFKHLHRLILTSNAYRMRSSDAGPGDRNVALDPDNDYFWRMNVRRMEGEVVRDSVLFLSGTLDPRIGGPDGPVKSAEAGTRRTIYYRYASGDNVPLLSMFDAASVTECYRRHETIVPQQALALSNSGMVLSKSALIARLIDTEVGGDPQSRRAFVHSAFERMLGRLPAEAEQTECTLGLKRLTEALEAEGTKEVGPEARARSALVHVLLNHNDFVSIR
jgi:hypothetical protein